MPRFWTNICIIPIVDKLSLLTSVFPLEAPMHERTALYHNKKFSMEWGTLYEGIRLAFVSGVLPVDSPRKTFLKFFKMNQVVAVCAMASASM